MAGFSPVGSTPVGALPSAGGTTGSIFLVGGVPNVVLPVVTTYTMPSPNSLSIRGELPSSLLYSGANFDFTFGLVVPTATNVVFDFGTGGAPVAAYFPSAGSLTLGGNTPTFTLPTTYATPPGNLTLTGILLPTHYEILVKASSFIRTALAAGSNPPVKVSQLIRTVLRSQDDAGPTGVRVSSLVRTALAAKTGPPVRTSMLIRTVLRSLADAPAGPIFPTFGQNPYRDSANFAGRFFGGTAIRRVFKGAKIGLSALQVLPPTTNTIARVQEKAAGATYGVSFSSAPSVDNYVFAFGWSNATAPSANDGWTVLSTHNFPDTGFGNATFGTIAYKQVTSGGTAFQTPFTGSPAFGRGGVMVIEINGLESVSANVKSLQWQRCPTTGNARTDIVTTMSTNQALAISFTGWWGSATTFPLSISGSHWLNTTSAMTSGASSNLVASTVCGPANATEEAIVDIGYPYYGMLSALLILSN